MFLHEATFGFRVFLLPASVCERVCQSVCQSLACRPNNSWLVQALFWLRMMLRSKGHIHALLLSSVTVATGRLCVSMLMCIFLLLKKYSHSPKITLMQALAWTFAKLCNVLFLWRPIFCFPQTYKFPWSVNALLYTCYVSLYGCLLRLIS